MKNIIVLVFSLIVWTKALPSSQEIVIKSNHYQVIDNDDRKLNSGNNGVLVINSFDSVFFDLSIAVSTSTTIEIPVYFRSDDVINALDFSLKYDHSKLDYDTTINLTGYIDALSFYNTNDSTVRLTSYSFTQPYENDSILFLIRFNILSGQLCSGDLDSVSTLLNGDACSNNVVECLNSGFYEVENELNATFYPNPANDFVEFEFEKISELEISDALGKCVYSNANLSNEISLKIDINQWNSGMYFIKFVKGNSVNSGKLLVE